ncbi:MAG: AbrB family looped-hinge helix DNA binding protein [Verrucomicrobiales bacterium]|jgi:AbrB family looped-hinge helix DNA binding protein
MKVNEQGQITIPEALREQFGPEAGANVEVEVTKNGILLKPMSTHRAQVEKWFRDEHGDEMASLTTDQIMKLIQ